MEVLILNGFYFVNYITIFYFLFYSFIISYILFFLSYLINKQTHEKELISHYECGFIPFDNSRKKFEIKFYLIAILFLIFDLEVVFLFPFALTIINLNFINFLIITFFIFVLTIGFYFEWIYKGLEWQQ